MSEPIPEVIPDPNATPPLVGNDGAFRQDWHASLGDDFGDVPDNIKGLKDLPTMAKGLIEGQKMIATHGQTIGDLKKQLEENKPIGAPEVYTISQKPEGVADDQWDQTGVDEDVAFLREQGVTDNQAVALNQRFTDKMEAYKEAQAQGVIQAKELSIQNLQAEWGRDYEGKVVAANETAVKLGIDIGDSSVGNNTGLIKALHMISSSIGESVLKGAGPANTANITGGENFLAKSNSIVQNPSDPLYKAYHNPGDPQHEVAQRTHGELLNNHLRVLKQ